MTTETKFDPALTATITLSFPVDFDGEKINSLTMRRPKVRDKLKAKKVKGDDEDRALALMADLVEQPLEMLGELDEVDIAKLGEQYAAFTGRTPETDAS
jgi:hypothetical protein